MLRVWIVLVSAALAAWMPVAHGQAAEELVQQTTERVMAHIQAQKDVLKAEPTRVYELVNHEILPYFDFVRMSQWVLGKYWRQASPEQRAQFTEEFRTLLVKTYAKALLEYSNGGVTVLPARGADDTPERTTVRTEVRQAGGFPIPINYSMYQSGDSWRVFDVTIDGISLVSNYRNAFAARIRQDGLDKLIALMVERNQSGTE